MQRATINTDWAGHTLESCSLVLVAFQPSATKITHTLR